MPFNYVETVRDIRALIAQEAREGESHRLLRNVDALDAEFRRVNEQLQELLLSGASKVDAEVAKRIAEDALKVLNERVDWLVWMMRGVVGTIAIQVVAAVIFAFLMKGH